MKSYPNWAPAHLVEWVNRMRDKDHPLSDFIDRLITDVRMKEVWGWHADNWVQPNILNGAFTLAHVAYNATKLPIKPGNLSPKQRDKYFEKVRQHASALIELLSHTIYDNANYGSEIPEEKLEMYFRNDIQWSEEFGPRVVAYYLEESGIYRVPWNYPDSHISELLNSVIEWSRQDDYWSVTKSSKPIAQANSDSTKIIYFNCTVYTDTARSNGIKIPSRILATLANVALQLDDKSEIDEEIVRKQIARFVARVGPIKMGPLVQYMGPEHKDAPF